MRRRRNNRAGCHDAPANNARGFGEPTSPRQMLIHEIYLHGYTFSGHATLLPIIAHASNLFLVF